ITINKDTKVPNACLFTINKEDHTLGNIIKSLECNGTILLTANSASWVQVILLLQPP
uniref:DNA-directed RNA polymerase RBP11-like dimerisation domain-containing protein n=1 Tax=Nomascus leucogenys TaxID=61853 RepID=A0A2I3HSD0_NOMLE